MTQLDAIQRENAIFEDPPGNPDTPQRDAFLG